VESLEKDRIPKAEQPEYNDVLVAWKYEPDNDTDVVDAIANYAPMAKLDMSDHEQQLTDIYREIKHDGFLSLLYSIEIKKLLKEYPEFDVNICSPDGKTLLDRTIFQSQLKTAEMIINSPSRNPSQA